MNVVAELMERQTKIPPPVLGPEDLSVLTESLSSSLEAMEATRIPDTLGHLDLNPGNIIVSESRCAFLDWAEAYVGNPLFSLEYLLQHAGRAFRSDSAVRTKLVAAYCAQWNDVSSAAIADALVFAPLLAVFAYAVGTDEWQHPQRLQEPAAAGYLRNLVRRMRREANELAGRRSACLA
jgi:aminoglycoside phosphotransferase (APT) family kinase protein